MDYAIYCDFSLSKMHDFFFPFHFFWNQGAYNYFLRRLPSCQAKEKVVMEGALPAHLRTQPR